MNPARAPTNKVALRARAFQIMKERSFRFGDFILASGKASKYYVDMKPTMFDPEGATLLAELIFLRLADLKVDCIGGLEMGAVPLIASVNMLSYQKGRPIAGFFVRKDIKDHGTKKLVEVREGELHGKSVVILEDVITSGQSAMKAVKGAQDVGGRVVLVLSILDREEGAAQFFKDAAIPFDSLFRAREFLAT